MAPLDGVGFVLTLSAIVLFIAGILVMKSWPITGFLILVAGIALGGKAVQTPDDMEWFGGLCLLCGLIGSAVLVISKIW